jgi:hypothetical protein
MRVSITSNLRWCLRLLPLGALVAALAAVPGQNAAPVGLPDDWSHHHVVFSYPGTAVDAVRNGSYDRWARIVTDPRFALQQRKRAAAAAGSELRIAPAAPGAQADSVSAEQDSYDEPDRTETRFVRGVMPAISFGGEHVVPYGRHRRRHRHPQAPNNLHMDWSENLGSGATAGEGVYPAKFAFGTSAAYCNIATTPDFVVFNTGLAGTGMVGSTQASIVAYDNLYAGCAGGLLNYWAYDTAGGAILTSVTFSIDGSQVAFVQTSASAASFVVLKWAKNATETPGAPKVLSSTAPSSYRSCTAPCMTVIPFSGGANDSGSSVYPVYNADTIYVGDDAGKLHKFTGVFAGTPAEAGSPWPVSVSSGGEGLSSPVVDPGTGTILVGDYLVSASPNCATAGCGFLYRINPSTGAVTQSARLDFVNGLVGAPILDAGAETAYVFVGADSGFQSSSSPCGDRVPCSGVFQFPVMFSLGSGGTEARTGNGFEFMLPGALDNKIFTSGTPGSPTGNLYVIGGTGTANNTLYQIPITANVMGTPVAGPAISTNYTNGYFSAGQSITEIFTNSHDYIFTNALIFGAPAACTSSLTQGCVMGFDVTSGTITSSTLPTGATTEAGGTSAIIIDNTVAAGSNIYYTTLANQLCTTSGTTGGCGIQISQSAP